MKKTETLQPRDSYFYLKYNLSNLIKTKTLQPRDSYLS